MSAAASVADLLKRLDAPAAKETQVRTVQLDAQVVLKIVQHCNKALPQLVTGQLLGLDVGQTLEVTDCFPFPVSSRGPPSGMAGGQDLSAYWSALHVLVCKICVVSITCAQPCWRTPCMGRNVPPACERHGRRSCCLGTRPCARLRSPTLLSSAAPAQTSVTEEDTGDESAGANYQLEMMRCLREVIPPPASPTPFFARGGPPRSLHSRHAACNPCGV